MTGKDEKLGKVKATREFTLNCLSFPYICVYVWKIQTHRIFLFFFAILKMKPGPL